MGKSIIQDEKVCFYSGATQWLEKHHIFYGQGRRQLSEKYGLFVWLRHDLHNEPPNGVHFNPDVRRELEVIGQKAFIQHYPDRDFMEIFGRNYIHE